MNYKIGFTENNFDNRIYKPEETTKTTSTPVKSVVQVYFSCRAHSWAYYNDSFDLHEGDIVYVEGKLEGERGIVANVNYNYKIKLSDYKKVIAVADTDVKGELCFGKSHLIAFETSVIPFEKVVTWLKAPDKPDDEIVSGNDGTAFPLDDLAQMNAMHKIMDRGYGYYFNNNVVYVSLEGEKGRAIVEGSEFYEVEFTYKNGEISCLTCRCYCNYICKHEVAVMFQLRDLLKNIEEIYADKFEKTGCFYAVSKNVFSSLILDKCNKGSIVL